MGRRCCIAGCSSNSRLPEHHGVTYHSFPLDATIRSIWLRNSRLSAERNITKSVLVCSRHFRRVDFQPQRSGKYLLKQRVFPTVFPWGRVDSTQIEADAAALNSNNGNAAGVTALSTHSSSTVEDATKATVEATVAQIMAETAELNANSSAIKLETHSEDGDSGALELETSTVCVKFEPVTSFNPGTRLEAQDFDGGWHVARVVEVDNDDREVLIKFEKTGKNKSTIVGTEEWIPMNSTRLRQKISLKVLPTFELEEKCMARWSGPRKFPGTIKKLLGNDTYEVLFDDGYVKNVRAIHMNKILPLAEGGEIAIATPVADKSIASASPQWSAGISSSSALSNPPVKTVKQKPLQTTSSSKKRVPLRKDWPLLDMSKLDLTSLNLPEIPHDGEWTCHWVNDQPIGIEGFLIVGEHRKPTVIVDDWRLPPGWVKHMYQRSNVLGKWDVILVTPSGKRFRSKADLKVFLEEQGQFYNPDIYDFSIHRRRAKDINAYVFTTDYTPQLAHKPKATVESSPTTANSNLDTTATANNTLSTTLNTSSSSQFIETPVATAIPPMELMTQPTGTTGVSNAETGTPVHGTASDAGPSVGNGFAYIGGLKVQIIDNLFRCPKEGCTKNFRKENHVQIHVKHYHKDIAKLSGVCPKMMDLAEKRTHPIQTDLIEPLPKNQIPNQTFFAKLHQQDLEHARAHRKGGQIGVGTNVSAIEADLKTDVKLEKMEVEPDVMNLSAANVSGVSLINSTANSSVLEQSLLSSNANSPVANLTVKIPLKRSRYSSPNKRTSGARKSNRQRTTRHYLTAAQATGVVTMPPSMGIGDSSFGVADFEETRHSFNTTPDNKMIDAIKRRVIGAPATPLSSVDSPVTADSGSSSYQALHAPSSNDADTALSIMEKPQYIKENGELIKIVRMRQEEIINCLCSYGEEDGLMLQCELCLCWQHGVCNGIDKESDVPDKYVCYICRNPQRARESMRFKHDQDWLYDGKLPVASYHIPNPDLPKRNEILKKSHSLTGNLLELKNFMHSLRVKINIANNRCHPKLYLWAKKWDEEQRVQVKTEQNVKVEFESADTKDKDWTASPSKKIKVEHSNQPVPNIPQPEAPIDPGECQHRLLDHIKVQQNLVANRLNKIEKEIEALEKQDVIPDLKDADLSQTKDILSTFIKDLDVLKQIAKLNALEHTKEELKNPKKALKTEF